jgi:hypothetical protein
MKLTHIAIVLTVGLAGVMVWLLMDARSDARAARNKLEIYEHRGAAQDRAMQSLEDKLLLDQMEKNKQRTDITLTPPPPLPKVTSPEPVVPSPSPAPVQSGASSTQKLAASPHISTEALNAPPPPMTALQRIVMNAPAIAKVKEVHNEAGFVIITAGISKRVEKGMTFSLRRLDSVVGRIKVTEIDNGEAVGDLVAHSVPTGVSVEVDDDVIQDIPQE